MIVDPHGLEVAADWRNVRSPETYTGYRQSSGFAQEATARFDEPFAYAGPRQLPLNSWGLTGNWTVAQHAAMSKEAGGRIAYQFHARDLNLVMGPLSQGASIPFRVFLDGQPAADASGTDEHPDGRGIVSDQRTDQGIRQPGTIACCRFDIVFGGAGVEVGCLACG